MSTIARLPLESYDKMIAAGLFDGPNRQRVELIYGELREMNPIGPKHEEIVDRLVEWTTAHVPRNKVRLRVQNSIGLPSLASAPEPDIAWVTQKSYLSGRPRAEDVLLIIEVAESSLDYDRGEKAELYAAAGIQDYWVVNLVEQCIEVFRDPDRGRYRSLVTIYPGDAARPLKFPELALDDDALCVGFSWATNPFADGRQVAGTLGVPLPFYGGFKPNVFRPGGPIGNSPDREVP